MAELPIPASWSQKKRASVVTGDVLPISRPDLDNYVKSGLDSINEIVIRDDCQIVEVRARKRYSNVPKLVMTIFPLGGVTIFLPGGAKGLMSRRFFYKMDRAGLGPVVKTVFGRKTISPAAELAWQQAQDTPISEKVRAARSEVRRRPAKLGLQSPKHPANRKRAGGVSVS